jgi:SAM-dependent methyltransferase
MPHERLAAERDFFDAQYRIEQPPLNGFYAASGVRREYERKVLANCAGLRVLEYGCGTGSNAFALAARGAKVIGVDISNTAIELARHQAAASDNLRFQLGDAEALDFPPETFDLVCGTSILHHLDIERALTELKRVLKPGGRAIFYEPLAYNPLINLYRRMTPHLHTRDEHPLNKRDLGAMSERFGRVAFRFADLLALAAIPVLQLPGGRAILRGLERADQIVMRVPGLRWWGAVVLIEIYA